MPRWLCNFRVTIGRIAALAAAVVLCVGSGAPARADGMAQIQQADGTVDTYPGVKIQIVQKSLTMTSPDGKGTLIVSRAACFYRGDIMLCLPTGATLVQAGSVSSIKLKSGTIYLNLTGQSQPLSRSSMQLPPHSVMVALTTARGTYISLSGTIDKESK